MTNADAFRILMEQRAIVDVFTLKCLVPRDFQAELVIVYGVDAPVLRTFYKCHKRFAQGRTEPFDDPRSGRPFQNDLAEAVPAMF
jgi:hypothetical protein